ncbi:MAG TPA: dihydropteroate synthase, partial [Arenibaculum sp.]|nr:dihydropteroate synthase [Arenibaculum sp.]
MFPSRPRYSWKLGDGRVLELGAISRVMGILNVTPDSFSDGGLHLDIRAAVARGEAMVREGADLIDVGGESTRPGAPEVPAEEEIRRVVPVIEALRPLGVPISIDTRKAAVARQALEAGAVVVNDVSGLRFDPELARIVKRFGAGLVVMHSRGTPEDMAADSRYHDVVEEVSRELGEACDRAAAAGIEPEAVMIDPGLGFAKTADHNLTLIRELDRLAALGRPILVGGSRKSFIGKLLDRPPLDR